MTSTEEENAYEFLVKFEAGIGRLDTEQRTRKYARDQFLEDLGEAGKSFKILGLTSQLIMMLIQEGQKVHEQSRRQVSANPEMATLLKDAVRMYGFEIDAFLQTFKPLMEAVVVNRTKQKAQVLFETIEGKYALQMKELSQAIPNQLEKSRELVGQALESFRAGRKEEATLYTRKAWEACVNFALERLPKQVDLRSLTKKTKYVLAEIEQGDRAEAIVRIKDLFEGRFLHELESTEPIQEPEIPFYIALTVGFIHLVSKALVPPGDVLAPGFKPRKT